LFDVKNLDLTDGSPDYIAMEAFYEAVDTMQQRYLTGLGDLDKKVLALKKLVSERIAAWHIPLDDKYITENQIIILQNAGFETTASIVFRKKIENFLIN
jgi:hypothetical protein